MPRNTENTAWLWWGGGLCIILLLLFGWHFGGPHQSRAPKAAASLDGLANAIGNSSNQPGKTPSPPRRAGITRQLPYVMGRNAVAGLPPGLLTRSPGSVVPREVPGRRVPPLTLFSELTSAKLKDRVVPLPEANTLAHLNFEERRFGRLQTGTDEISLFNPEAVLVKFRALPHVGVLRVEPMREWDAVQALAQRADVQFAELDTLQRRQFSPNDPLIASQWHHQRIGSFQAWDKSLGQHSVRIAIVDTPFQMDHPDLAANTVSGWDVVNNVAVTSSAAFVSTPGYDHATMCAGMAAAVIGNGLGVAGAGNCDVLPININGYISDMYNATIWAASNGVRVVNISWTGGTDDTLEAAGYFLKTHAR